MRHCVLQVLTLSGNRLRSLPADLGWLSLKQLSLVDNPDLHIPIHVLQKGFK
jgi:Leucine-rich repeat (LRR) protein